MSEYGKLWERAAEIRRQIVDVVPGADTSTLDRARASVASYMDPLAEEARKALGDDGQSGRFISNAQKYLWLQAQLRDWADLEEQMAAEETTQHWYWDPIHGDDAGDGSEHSPVKSFARLRALCGPVLTVPTTFHQLSSQPIGALPINWPVVSGDGSFTLTGADAIARDGQMPVLRACDIPKTGGRLVGLHIQTPETFKHPGDGQRPARSSRKQPQQPHTRMVVTCTLCKAEALAPHKGNTMTAGEIADLYATIPHSPDCPKNMKPSTARRFVVASPRNTGAK